MRETPLIEVEPRPQRQLLAEEARAAPAEQRREALERAQCARAVTPEPPPAGPSRVRRPGQLARLQPAPVCDLLALAPAGADHERLGGRDLVGIRVGRRDAVQ